MKLTKRQRALLEMFRNNDIISVPQNWGRTAQGLERRRRGMFRYKRSGPDTVIEVVNKGMLRDLLAGKEPPSPRELVLKLVEAHPGLTTRGLSLRRHRGISTVRDHLNMLRWMGKVRSDGGRPCKWYVK